MKHLIILFITAGSLYTATFHPDEVFDSTCAENSAAAFSTSHDHIKQNTFMPIEPSHGGKSKSISPTRYFGEWTQIIELMLQEDINDENDGRDSPTKCLLWDTYLIIDHYFCMLGLRKCFADALSEIYGNPNVMQYFCQSSSSVGQPWRSERVHELCDEYEKELYRKQKPISYGWVIITRANEITKTSGVIFAHHSPLCINSKEYSKEQLDTKEVSIKEIARILATNAQGCRFGTSALRNVSTFLDATCLVAKSHKNNLASQKSREKLGFKSFIPKDRSNAMVYQWLPPYKDIDNQERIRFSYSGNEVSLAYLMGGLSLGKLLRVSTKQHYIFPLTSPYFLDSERYISCPHLLDAIKTNNPLKTRKKALEMQVQRLQEKDIRKLPQILINKAIEFVIFKNESSALIGLLYMSAPPLQVRAVLSRRHKNEASKIEEAFTELLKNYNIIPRMSADSIRTVFPSFSFSFSLLPEKIEEEKGSPRDVWRGIEEIEEMNNGTLKLMIGIP